MWVRFEFLPLIQKQKILPIKLTRTHYTQDLTIGGRYIYKREERISKGVFEIKTIHNLVSYNSHSCVQNLKINK